MKKVYLITCTFCWVNETSNPTDYSNIYLGLIPSGEENLEIQCCVVSDTYVLLFSDGADRNCVWLYLR